MEKTLLCDHPRTAMLPDGTEEWRENAKEKVKEQNLVKARTAVMNGYVKTFVELYPDKEPDEVKLTVKVIE